MNKEAEATGRVMVSVDAIFTALEAALQEAIALQHDKTSAKAIAWDVQASFSNQFGRYRTGAKA